MELSEELARTCVAVKYAADLREIRDQFEALSSEEEGLREHAKRWENIATRRAAKEEGGIGGYASTALGRFFGLPRSALELAGRGLATGAGAYAGGQLGSELGEHYARIPSESIPSLFIGKPDKATKGALPKAVTPIAQQRLFSSIEPGINAQAEQILLDQLKKHYPSGSVKWLSSLAKTNPAAKAIYDRSLDIAETWKSRERDKFNQLFRDLSETNPEIVSAALAKDPLAKVPFATRARKAITGYLGDPVARNIPGIESVDVDPIRQRIIAQFGEENMPSVRRVLKHTLDEMELPSGAGKWKSRGRWAGAGAGALLSGLPFVASALWSKHKGGERAQMAKAEARRLLDQAAYKGTQREELLNSLEAASEK